MTWRKKEIFIRYEISRIESLILHFRRIFIFTVADLCRIFQRKFRKGWRKQRENKGRTNGEQGGQGGRPLPSPCFPLVLPNILKGECYADLCRNFENFANLCRNFENFAKFRQRENFGKKILADGRRYGKEEKGFFLLLLYRRPLQFFFFPPET